MKTNNKYIFSLVAGFCITLTAALLFLPESTMAFLIFLLITLVCTCATYAILTLMDKQVFRTWIHLAVLRIDKKLDIANIRTISAYLLSFLYHVLEQNKGSLSFNLGAEPSCLLAPGNGINHRESTVFFRFACISPEKPEMELAVMRQVIQAYVWGELSNYGIPGLRSCFQSRVYGALPSVYVDQVYYSESRHTLYIEVLYICTEEGAKYAVKAHQRDNTQTQSEKEVFDDEVC